MHYGMPPLRGPTGEPVHAVLGFCNKLLQLRTLFPHHAMLAAFDNGKSESRVSMLEQYKSTRAPMPAELSAQMRVIQSAAIAFGVPCVSVPGYEADDVIATCVRAYEAGMHEARARPVDAVCVVSTDKDMLQLVSPSGETPNVTVYNDQRKHLIDAAGVVEIHGV